MSKRLLIVMIIFAVDVFAAFAWLFYTETPGYVLGEMRRRMAATTAVRLVADAAGEGKTLVPSLSAALSGSDKDRKEATGAFTLHATTDLDLSDLGEPRRMDLFRLTLTTSSTPPAVYDGELRTVGSRRFLRLGESPDSGPLARALLGEWAELEPHSLDWPLVRPSRTAETDGASAAKLRDLFRSTKLVTVKQELPEAILDGIRHYRYRVEWKPEAMRAFMILATGLREKRSLSDDDVARLSDELGRIVPTDVEVLIRKRDFFLSAVRVQGALSDLKTGEDARFSATVSLSRWNEPAEIAIPHSSRPIRGFLELAGETGLKLSSGKEADAATEAPPAEAEPLPVAETTSTPFDFDDDPDKDGLTNTLEAFYRTDPLNPDTDGDGYMDGYEVNYGYDPTGPGELFRFGR